MRSSGCCFKVHTLQPRFYHTIHHGFTHFSVLPVAARRRPGYIDPVQLFTAGHSNRTFDQLLALLRQAGVGAVADVRRFPGSRRLPHFNREPLAEALREAGIEYHWLEALGGRRPPLPPRESPNGGLEDEGFRGYADYMLGEAFRSGVLDLLALARRLPTAVLCAEALFWRCHRRLLSDFLACAGVEVVHLLEPGRRQAHTLTPGAVCAADGSVRYPPPPALDFTGSG